MKRVIDGQTYNTDTATTAARYEYENDKGYEVDATLYQTRGGAFFIVHHWQTPELQDKYYFEAITREGVLRLVARQDNLEIVDESVLAEPPEAAVAAEPEATLYVRIPASLKRRVDEAAKERKLSNNAWAMHCMERCLQGSDKRDFFPLSVIWYIASAARVDRNIDWSRETFLDALDRISQEAAKLAVRFDINPLDFRNEPELLKLELKFPLPDPQQTVGT